MKQIVPVFKSNLMRKSLILLLSVFAFSFATVAQNPSNGGSITMSQTICAGETPAELTSTAPATGGGTGTIEYLWMFATSPTATLGGAGYTSIPNSNSENYQPGALYTTTYFVRCARRIGSGNLNFTAESNGNNPLVITVNQLPNPIFGGNPGTAFTGTTITFTADEPGATYAWDFNGDGIIDCTTPTCNYTYNSSGNFNVTLTVTNSEGCVASFTQQLFISNPLFSSVIDPCSNCEDGLNYTLGAPNLGYYVHDHITVYSGSNENWTLTNPVNLFDNAGNPLVIPAGGLPLTGTSGTYTLNPLYFNASIGGWTATVSNGTISYNVGPGGTTTPCVPCPASPLPVELVDFKATVKGKAVELSWITASEIDNSHFEIERSLDGARFDFVGKQDGVGSTTVNSYYNFTDIEAVPGETYYRLKQVDIDGEYNYSDVVSVRIESDQVIVNVTPNPVTDLTMVRFGADLAPNTVLELVSTTGQIVRTFNVEDNASSLEIDMTGLAEGIYLLSVANASREQKAFYKVVKF